MSLLSHTGITNTGIGHPRFFLGSDSAPHPPHSKSTATPTHACAAGVYTSPVLLPLVAHLLESFGALHQLEDFVSTFGRTFYQRPATAGKKVKLRKSEGKSIEELYQLDNNNLVPFWAGKEIGWEIVEG